MLIDQFVRENIDKASKGLFDNSEYYREADRVKMFKTTISGKESSDSLDNMVLVHALLYLCYIVNWLSSDYQRKRFDDVQKAIIQGKKLYDFHNVRHLIDDLRWSK